MDSTLLTVVLGIGIGISALWLLVSAVGALFIFTGPPEDAHDVDIDPKATVKKVKK